MIMMFVRIVTNRFRNKLKEKCNAAIKVFLAEGGNDDNGASVWTVINQSS